MRYIKTIIFVALITVFFGLFASFALVAKDVSALTFTPMFKPFKFNIQALKLKGIFSFGFNKSLIAKGFSECTDITLACEEEYNACRGSLDYFDQTNHELLLQAKNACIYSCESKPEPCFGLDIIKKETPPQTYFKEPIQPLKECTGPTARSCQLVTGGEGTQTAIDCDTQTGEWNYGECIAPIAPPLFIYVEPPQTCQGAQPTCPSGTVGSYVCQNGQWTSQCQNISNCPAIEPDWRVCKMADGRWGREYVDYCNEQTGQWAWRPCNVYPNLQPVCTSFTYSNWNTCSMGEQGRTILTREPYGCAGGNPVTVQSCCQAAEPSCASTWTGSYTCISNSWLNTCVPPGPEQCYKGVKYRIYNNNAYAIHVGTSNWNEENNCREMINDGSIDIWNNYNSEALFKSYVDSMYREQIPNSCNPQFVYTQC